MIRRYITHIPAEYFVPSRVLGAVDIGGGLVDRVPNAHTAVRVHTSEAIVLSQFGLWQRTEVNKSPPQDLFPPGC